MPFLPFRALYAAFDTSDLSQRIGGTVMASYTKKLGLLESYDIDGIHNAKGSFEFPKNDDLSLAWAGIGQYTTLFFIMERSFSAVDSSIMRSVSSPDGKFV